LNIPEDNIEFTEKDGEVRFQINGIAKNLLSPLDGSDMLDLALLVPIGGSFLVSFPTSVKRKNPVEFQHTYFLTFFVSLEYPDSWTLTRCPKEIDVDTEFFRYEYETLAEESRVEILREFTLKLRDVPVEYYPEFRSDISEVMRYDKRKMTFEFGN
jgi:hypothetical protein